jgi:hypothetical protein
MFVAEQSGFTTTDWSFAPRSMTASEYVFAAAMTVLIVWLVAEVSGQALER